jgi:predicted GNAT family acetyltransferase
LRFPSNAPEIAAIPFTKKAALERTIFTILLVIQPMEKVNVTNNKEKQRFELNLGTDIAYMEYRYQNNTKVLMHTYVPEKYRGKGNAVKFIQQVLDNERKAKSSVMVNCAAVSRFIKEHPEYNDLVAKFRPAVAGKR